MLVNCVWSKPALIAILNWQLSIRSEVMYAFGTIGQYHLVYMISANLGTVIRATAIYDITCSLTDIQQQFVFMLYQV